MIEECVWKDSCLPPAIADHCRVNLIPGDVGHMHRFQNVDIVNLGRGDVAVIPIDGLIHETGSVMSFEASNDTCISWLDMCHEIWCEVFNVDVRKVIRWDMRTEVVLK